MKEPRPALENLCCLNVQCNAYGQRGQANLKVRKIYGVDRIRYLRCGCCGEEFSERKGTALFNCKISEAQAVSVMEHLDSGCGLNVTARLVGVSKDAVGRLLGVGGRVSYQLHDRLVRNLQPVALQFDEKWSYVAKKQRHVTGIFIASKYSSILAAFSSLSFLAVSVYCFGGKGIGFPI